MDYFITNLLWTILENINVPPEIFNKKKNIESCKEWCSS